MLAESVTERPRYIVSRVGGIFVFGPGISLSAYGVNLVEPYIEIIVPVFPQGHIPFVDYVYVYEDTDVFKRARLLDMGGVIIPVLSLEDLIVWILKESMTL